MNPAFLGISSRLSAVTRAKSSQTPVRKLSATCNELGVRLEERGRLARELHDSTSELLVALDLQLRRLKELPLGTGSKAFGDVLLALGNTVSELHDEVRSVGNEGHFPPQFLNRELALMAAEFADRTGLVIRTQFADFQEKVSPEVAHALFRVAQEALANASRHACATNVSLCLHVERGSVKLRVTDDGLGFPRSLSRPRWGHGIANMRIRLEQVGGELTIQNLDHGAMVEATVASNSQRRRRNPLMGR